MRSQQLQTEAKACESEEDGEREEGKGEFFLDGVGGAGMGSDSTANLLPFGPNSPLFFQARFRATAGRLEPY
jgi:hypothetical protein